MVAIVSVETVLLVLLVVLVAGLLRSHAEILRRLGAAGDAVAAPPPRERGAAETRAPALSGNTPDGDVVTLDFAGEEGAPTLLAFLTSGCSSCGRFWSTLAEPRLPSGVQTVIVTHGAERERPAKLRTLAPRGVPVVMSSPAWEHYGVPGSPYFVLVDSTIRGEGIATTWEALASLVSDAIEDQAAGGNGTTRAHRVDDVLAGAGIGPDHPSLYPGGRSD
jgi:hypothetical protein